LPNNILGIDRAFPVEFRRFLKAPPLRFLASGNDKMLGITAERLRYFLEPDQKPRWVYLCGALLTAAIATGCWMQTDYFVTLFDFPSYDLLRSHMAKSQQIQASIAKKSKSDTSQSATYLFFSDSQKAQLEDARRFILSDPELEKKLKDRFGTSLKDVHTVIAPSWETDNKGYCTLLGITEEGGWSDFQQAARSCEIGATTIRDKPDEGERTVDGRPRIVLNMNAVASTSWTRLVVFHEMLHAMNIPGFKPTRLARVQTDLTYLPEYRWFVAKENLDWGGDFYWFFTVFFGAVCLVITLLFVRDHGRGQTGGTMPAGVQ
jgi:hypothetical protein